MFFLLWLSSRGPVHNMSCSLPQTQTQTNTNSLSHYLCRLCTHPWACCPFPRPCGFQPVYSSGLGSHCMWAYMYEHSSPFCGAVPSPRARNSNSAACMLEKTRQQAALVLHVCLADCRFHMHTHMYTCLFIRVYMAFRDDAHNGLHK